MFSCDTGDDVGRIHYDLSRIHEVAEYTMVYSARVFFCLLSVFSAGFLTEYTMMWPNTCRFDRIHADLAEYTPIWPNTRSAEYTKRRIHDEKNNKIMMC